MSKGNGQGTVLKRCACAPKGASERAKLAAWRKCSHTWSVRYYAGGRLVWESFKSEPAAKVRQAEIMRAKLTGEDRAAFDRKRAEMPFVTWAEQWIAGPGRGDRTRTNYRSALRIIARAIGTASVRQIADDRQAAKRLLEGRTDTYAPKIRNVLTGALNAAIDDGMIGSHSLTRMRVEVASTKRAEWIPTTAAQRETLAREMGEWGLTVWTAYYCGLRAGESLGLRKSDFVAMIGADGPFTALRLTRQRQVHNKTQMAATAPLKARTDDDSERWVSVPPELAAMIESAPAYGDDECLFPAGFNSTLYARVRKARAVAGLPSTWSLHDLRHECASDLLAMGVSDTLVAQQIGHTSTTILHRVYAHQVPAGLVAVLKARSAA